MGVDQGAKRSYRTVGVRRWVCANGFVVVYKREFRSVTQVMRVTYILVGRRGQMFCFKGFIAPWACTTVVGPAALDCVL